MKRIDLIKTGGFKAGEHLIVSQVSPPATDDGTGVVIQVKASAINPVDYKMAEYGFLLPEKLPAALGCDVAGVVVQAPPSTNSNGLKVGSRVVTYLGANKASQPDFATSRGAYVEQVAVRDTSLVAQIPNGMSFAEAASLPVGALTASLLLQPFHAPDNASLSFLLIWGTSSSVGYNCVQLAVQRGYKVIAVASGKHEAVMKEFGVTAFVDYRNEDVASKVTEICRDSASAAKLIGAVDCIGEPTSFGTCAELVKSLGDDESKSLTVSTVNPFGLPDPPTGVTACPVDLGMALEQDESRALIKKWLPEMVQKLKPMPIHYVKGPFAAETVEKAFQICKNGVSGEKVVIEWTEEE